METFHTEVRDYKIGELKTKIHNGYTLCIYGVGITADHVSKKLMDYGILSLPVYIVDDIYYSSRKDGGKRIISLSEYRSSSLFYKSVVVYGMMYYTIMKEALENKFLSENFYDFGWISVHGCNPQIDYEFVMNHYRRFKNTEDILTDSKSKSLYNTWLRSNIEGNTSELYESYHDNDPYFNMLTKGEMDTFFDCGAYDGDTIMSFVEYYKSYNEIYAFEPDEINCKLLEKNMSNNSIRNVRILNCGVSSESGSIYFNSNGDATSFVAENGEQSILVEAIDNIDKNHSRISYIKMDIEGSEFEALKGAKETIKNERPILGICVYHKREDLIEIPEYIYSLVGDSFNYFLRYYGDGFNDLVFYAIPT